MASIEVIESLDKECSALGGLFQQVVNDMKVSLESFLLSRFRFLIGYFSFEQRRASPLFQRNLVKTFIFKSPKFLSPSANIRCYIDSEVLFWHPIWLDSQPTRRAKFFPSAAYCDAVLFCGPFFSLVSLVRICYIPIMYKYLLSSGFECMLCCNCRPFDVAVFSPEQNKPMMMVILVQQTMKFTIAHQNVAFFFQDRRLATARCQKRVTRLRSQTVSRF